MSMREGWNWGRDERLPLEDGCYLRLLTAMEVLEAGREARMLPQDEREEGLCANACLLAKALEKDGTALFVNGEDALKTLTVSRIQELAGMWAKWDREVNPGLAISQEEVERLKKAWSARRKNAYAGACSGHWGSCQRKRGR